MVKQARSPDFSPRRGYRLGRRLQQVDRTRQRIIEATIDLHTSVGPSAASITAIAAAAGVTRLTVYRHFDDLERLFEACKAHWAALHPAPDPDRWRAIEDPAQRIATAIGELYAWYESNAADLGPIYRDVGSMPASTRAAMWEEASALAAGLLTGSDGVGTGDATIRALAGHLTGFGTWQSLTAMHGLSTTAAAGLACRVLLRALDEARAGQAGRPTASM